MNAASAEANLATLLVQSARRFPAEPAVATGKRCLHSYAALSARVGRLAAAMSRGGLFNGERAAIVSRNVPEYIEALLACWHAGVCAVPVNAKLHPDELVYVLQDCGARWAFVDAEWESALSPRHRELS